MHSGELINTKFGYSIKLKFAEVPHVFHPKRLFSTFKSKVSMDLVKRPNLALINSPDGTD